MSSPESRVRKVEDGSSQAARCVIVRVVPDIDEASLLSVNAAFYDAFERRDFDTMSDIWEHSDRCSCTHPGWSTLRGWGAVAGSWVSLLQNNQRLQFILTNEVAQVNGDTGWVSCDENVLDGDNSSTVAALNIFVRAEASPFGWKMVLHQGSLVHASMGR